MSLRFISYRTRSNREVVDYLRLRWGYDQNVIDGVVARLRSADLVNDARFAASWVADRVSLRPHSRRRLAAELYQKGLSSDDVEVALSGLSADDYREMLAGVAVKKRREVGYQDDQKLIAFLSRQGYAHEDIVEALRLAAFET